MYEFACVCRGGAGEVLNFNRRGTQQESSPLSPSPTPMAVLRLTLSLHPGLRFPSSRLHMMYGWGN